MLVKDLVFTHSNHFESDSLHAVKVLIPTKYGIKVTRITILNRITGFGWRDTETGYRDVNGQFWLASGNFDIRDHAELTVHDAIEKIKNEANNNKGTIPRKCFDIETRKKVGLW